MHDVPPQGATFRLVRQYLCHCGKPLVEVAVSVDPGPPPVSKFSAVCGDGHSVFGAEQVTASDSLVSTPCRPRRD